MGPGADRRGVDRPGAPGDHARTGVAVAVKVQYPGVGDAIQADLGNVGLLFGGLGQLFPGLDSGPLVDELRARLLEELDYEREAAPPAARSPTTTRATRSSTSPRCSRRTRRPRVLTTELAEGARFAEAETWPQDERDLAAETIFRFVFGSLYRLRLLQRRSAPRQLPVPPGGQRHVPRLRSRHAVRRRRGRGLRALIETHGARARPGRVPRRRSRSAGFLRPGATDLRRARSSTTSATSTSTCSRTDGSTIGHEFAERERASGLRRHRPVPRRDAQHAERPAARSSSCSGSTSGLFAILAPLGATANWRRLAEEMWPWVEGPPSTPLGRARARVAGAERGR